MSNSAIASTSIVKRLQELARLFPDRPCYTFLSGRNADAETISYGELDLAVRRLATALLPYKHRHDKAILIYESGLDFIKAFFACLYAGIIAIPINPPSRKEKSNRFSAIASDSGARLLLGVSAMKQRLPEHLFPSETADTDYVWFASDQALEPLNDLECHFPEIDPAAIALLQYTSGSTSIPKGVMISHQNIMANQHMIKQGFGHNEQSIVVGWLPHYHDMGLIGNILQPVYCNAQCILMAPMYFLQKPIRWLETISQYRATTSGGPNFAFDLCAREIELKDCQNIDLSSWTLAFCGAERVHPETITQFAKRFKVLGFNEKAFYPCYGLAEATLIATGGQKTKKPVIRRFDKIQLENGLAKPVYFRRKNTLQLTGCGQALLDEELLIVDPENRVPMPALQVGEIWLRGENIALGYWQRLEENTATFNAVIGQSNTHYFRSGDLGFICDGELFVTGRLKELIIIRGQNIYPHDIEYLVTNSAPELRPLSCIAFSVAIDQEEQLIILAEAKNRRLPNAPELIKILQERIVEEYGIRAHHIEILDPLKLPRTSSGKLQRLLCRQQYLEKLKETTV